MKVVGSEEFVVCILSIAMGISYLLFFVASFIVLHIGLGVFKCTTFFWLLM